MKNKGFSLIELIVVIAIMGVMMVVSGYSLNAISLANAKNCTEEIKYGLEKTRTQACSTDSGTSVASLSLYRDSNTGKVILSKSFEGDAKEIGGSRVSVQYRVKGAESYTDLGDETNQLVFTFDRSTGGFKSNYDSIIVSSGGRTYTLTCYLLTGKVDLE